MKVSCFHIGLIDRIPHPSFFCKFQQRIDGENCIADPASLRGTPDDAEGADGRDISFVSEFLLILPIDSYPASGELSGFTPISKEIISINFNRY